MGGARRLGRGGGGRQAGKEAHRLQPGLCEFGVELGEPVPLVEPLLNYCLSLEEGDFEYSLRKVEERRQSVGRRKKQHYCDYDNRLFPKSCGSRLVPPLPPG